MSFKDPVYTTSVDFQPFLVYMYTRKHQKTALLVYTRQETDCAYWKKPYTVHRRGGSPRFAVRVQGLPEKALLHRFHVISAMPFTLIRHLLIPSVRGSAPKKREEPKFLRLLLCSLHSLHPLNPLHSLCLLHPLHLLMRFNSVLCGKRGDERLGLKGGIQAIRPFGKGSERGYDNACRSNMPSWVASDP